MSRKEFRISLELGLQVCNPMWVLRTDLKAFWQVLLTAEPFIQEGLPSPVTAHTGPMSHCHFTHYFFSDKNSGIPISARVWSSGQGGKPTGESQVSSVWKELHETSCWLQFLLDLGLEPRAWQPGIGRDRRQTHHCWTTGLGPVLGVVLREDSWQSLVHTISSSLTRNSREEDTATI